VTDRTLLEQLIDLVDGRWPCELSPPGRETEPIDGIRQVLRGAALTTETGQAIVGAVTHALDRVPTSPDGLSHLLAALTWEGSLLRGLDLRPALRSLLLRCEELSGTPGRWGDLVSQLAKAWIELAPEQEVEPILATLPVEPGIRAALVLLATRRRFPDRVLEAIAVHGCAATEEDLRATLRFFLVGNESHARQTRQFLWTRSLPSHVRGVMRAVLQELGYLGWSRDNNPTTPLPRFGTGIPVRVAA
jgi:hypothetical protein